MKLIYDNETYKKYYKIIIKYLMNQGMAMIKELAYEIRDQIRIYDGIKPWDRNYLDFDYSEIYPLIKSMAFLGLIKIDMSFKAYVIELYDNIDYEKLIKNDFKFKWCDNDNNENEQK